MIPGELVQRLLQWKGGFVQADRSIFNNYLEHADIADGYQPNAAFYRTRCKGNRFAALSDGRVVANTGNVISQFRDYCTASNLVTSNISDSVISSWLGAAGYLN